jgi:hypothetical protein
MSIGDGYLLGSDSWRSAGQAQLRGSITDQQPTASWQYIIVAEGLPAPALPIGHPQPNTGRPRRLACFRLGGSSHLGAGQRPRTRISARARWKRASFCLGLAGIPTTARPQARSRRRPLLEPAEAAVKRTASGSGCDLQSLVTTPRIPLLRYAPGGGNSPGRRFNRLVVETESTHA